MDKTEKWMRSILVVILSFGAFWFLAWASLELTELPAVKEAQMTRTMYIMFAGFAVTGLVYMLQELSEIWKWSKDESIGKGEGLVSKKEISNIQHQLKNITEELDRLKNKKSG